MLRRKTFVLYRNFHLWKNIWKAEQIFSITSFLEIVDPTCGNSYMALQRILKNTKKEFRIDDISETIDTIALMKPV